MRVALSQQPHDNNRGPSPSDSSAKAYELKFVISENKALDVLDWANANLAPDSHVDPASGRYAVTSLYFDTRRWDVYCARAGYRWSKYRIRRYASESLVFLEVKSRRRNRVEKQRLPIAISQLSELAAGEVAAGNPGFWFRQGIIQKELEPSLLLTYQRTAFEERGMRVTIDTAMSCAPAFGYALDRVKKTSFLPFRAILELKYCGSLPDPFRSLISSMKLVRVAVSKYRLGVSATERS